MSHISLWRNRWMAVLHDAFWIPVSLMLAFWLRFNLETIPDSYMLGMYSVLLVAAPVQLLLFWQFGLYRGIWRFASVPDLVRIVKAVAIGALVTFVIMFVWQRMAGIPRSVVMLYPMLLMAGLALPRLAYRWLRDHRIDLATHVGKKALVVGAGRAGELLIRDMLKGGEYAPVALLDDNPKKLGLEIHGVRVAGNSEELAQAIADLNVDVVLLAMPTAPASLVRRIVKQCAEAKVACRMVPSLPELADGRVEVSQLREVRIEDLLGREEVALDNNQLSHFLAGKSVLVTGAGGSIGSELCRQIMAFAPARLVMLDNGEFNLYTIEGEMRRNHSPDEVVALLGDIRDEARMRWVFENYRPQVLFNAAAYKHVPLVEENPAEGVKTNVLGTCKLADLAVEYGCGKFVQVSTDKAVNPANVMGATKRAAEIYCQNLNMRSPGTAFITTRFGNVLGSAGSVVPLFARQIKNGGPVTVTHPEITRYFMTIPEAVSLILQAGGMGKGGEIFVLDMGEPVKIVDLAEQMIRLSGYEPGTEIEIVFTGLRPGEKLYEELFHKAESLIGTTHPKIMLSASREVDWAQMQGLLDQLHAACTQREVEQVRLLLHELVPEFVNNAEAAPQRPEGAALH